MLDRLLAAESCCRTRSSWWTTHTHMHIPTVTGSGKRACIINKRAWPGEARSRVPVSYRLGSTQRDCPGPTWALFRSHSTSSDRKASTASMPVATASTACTRIPSGPRSGPALLPASFACASHPCPLAGPSLAEDHRDVSSRLLGGPPAWSHSRAPPVPVGSGPWPGALGSGPDSERALLYRGPAPASQRPDCLPASPS